LVYELTPAKEPTMKPKLRLIVTPPPMDDGVREIDLEDAYKKYFDLDDPIYDGDDDENNLKIA
jgi:hypothetical protein